MTLLDQHIITSLDSLSEEGKEFARKTLGVSKPIVKKKDNSIEKLKMLKFLNSIKAKNK